MSRLGRSSRQRIIKRDISREEGGKGLMPLAAYPLPVFGGSLTVHLRQRRLNCLTSAGLCSALGVPTGDHSPNDCGCERNNTRDDRPGRITHRTILA